MPFPAQGHMNPLLKLAKLLHSKGFFITFIHTALYHRRLLRSSSCVSSSASFRFVTIDDGVSEDESTHTLHYVQDCMRRHCPASLRELLVREEDEGVVPPATCIVSDGVMSFTLDVAEELRLPQVLFWTMSACGFMGYLLFEEIIKRDMAPLKDDATARNDARLDARIDWVPTMKNARLRDMPTFITHPSHPKHQGMAEFMIEECRNASRAAAIVLNTFDALERPVLDAISASLAPPILTVGPLMGLHNIDEPKVWREEMGCLKWLEAQQDSSVLYINFGSIAVMTSAQLSELAFGIAGSGCRFLWVVRPDSVDGGLDGLPAGFVEETTGRGLMIMGWCPQEEVLAHRPWAGS
ncbi:UDP-glycosyltransferase 85A1 [Acorus calamus]|uniref:UDP-glycosyltransferase 85A1 n=1 Tax=Acorus calamus TaxID=4465 RepID=A0AAV9FM70_ACOCL|nr:UDP-glycosyltransferase 85A1 [Acorus calamus]